MNMLTNVAADGEYTDVPVQTTIVGAAKLTGRVGACGNTKRTGLGRRSSGTIGYHLRAPYSIGRRLSDMPPSTAT